MSTEGPDCSFDHKHIRTSGAKCFSSQLSFKPAGGVIREGNVLPYWTPQPTKHHPLFSHGNWVTSPPPLIFQAEISESSWCWNSNMRSEESKRPEATKQYSKRNKLQNEGKHWEIILQFFQSLQDLLALIYFWQEKCWHKMHWNKQIWVFTECYMVPNTRIFLNECLNILSKGWLKRLVVYLKLHYTGWMACLFSLRIHSNNHRKSYCLCVTFPVTFFLFWPCKA